MKIAIIGSGIAGLTASHFLQKNGHDVHLFESKSQLGMSAHTIELSASQSGLSVLGDVPSRMFNAALWPSVMELYQTLGLEISTVQANQSYRRGDAQSTLQFQLPFEWSNEIVKTATSSLMALADSFALGNARAAGSSNADSENHPISDQRSKFLLEINRLRKQGLRDLKTLDPRMAFLEYLDQNNFSAEFRDTFLFPALSSTVCTCSHDAISNYPAVILLDAMQHITGNQRLCRVEKGARLVSQRLSENVTVNLATPVGAVELGPDNVTLTTGETTLAYDHVVFATQANQIDGVYVNLSKSEVQVLDGFQYEDVDVVVHTDERFMPSSKSEWAVFNFAASDKNQESMCTVWMNQFHAKWQDEGMTQPIFQTIRPIQTVRSDRLIRQVKLQRPLVARSSWGLWQQLREIHREPERRIWFCGSYAVPGVPLLESAVKSAIEISTAISIV